MDWNDASDCCDYIILIGEKQAPPLKIGLLDGGFLENNIYIAKTLNEGLNHLKKLQQDKNINRTVLFENDLPDNF
jgi:UDP-N-acetylmuramoyl-tripeptide--D-alanyl-D-alanine ligase